MKFVSIVEIPVADFTRARTFYQNILDIHIEEMDMEGNQMGMFPDEGEAVNLVLIKGNGYEPSASGVVIYLQPGDDLQTALDKVEANGGKVLLPKTLITPEMGYYASFIDSEGNKLGMHSPR